MIKYLCKKEYLGTSGIIYFIKGNMYKVEIQRHSNSNDAMYDRLSIYEDEDLNIHIISFVRSSFNRYFYTLPEMREKVIDELLDVDV